MKEALAPDALAPLDGLRVLVVDDLAPACETLALLLEMEGAQARTALCARDALAIAPAFLPHAVVLDLGLPGIDGLQLARMLRRMPGVQEAALLALSGYSLDAGAWQQGAKVFDAAWTKPADTAEIVRFLAACAFHAGGREK